MKGEVDGCKRKEKLKKVFVVVKWEKKVKESDSKRKDGEVTMEKCRTKRNRRRIRRCL